MKKVFELLCVSGCEMSLRRAHGNSLAAIRISKHHRSVEWAIDPDDLDNENLMLEHITYGVKRVEVILNKKD